MNKAVVFTHAFALLKLCALFKNNPVKTIAYFTCLGIL